jgi:hypothetical protein
MFNIVLTIIVINSTAAVQTLDQPIRTVDSKAECQRLIERYDMNKQWLSDGTLISTALRCEPEAAH